LTHAVQPEDAPGDQAAQREDDQAGAKEGEQQTGIDRRQAREVGVEVE